MANSYDQEFNRSFPVQTEGPEFSPYVNKGNKGRKSYSLGKKMVMALATAGAAALITLSPLGFSVEDVDTDSALFLYEYAVQNDAEGDTRLSYSLYDGQELVEQGELEPGTDSLLLDELEPDTMYSLQVWNGDKHIKTLNFRTKPTQPVDFGFDSGNNKGNPEDYEPGIGAGEEEEEPGESPMPSAEPSPAPTVEPTATPAPTASPSPSPEPTPSPTPYVPEPVPATPKPTPAPQPTSNPYYDPEANPTTDPYNVLWHLNLQSSGVRGDYLVSINPLLNEEYYNFDRVGLTLRSGSTVLSTAEYFTADPYGYIIGYNTPGSYMLDVEVTFTNKATSVQDTLVISEPVTIVAGPPEISMGALTENPDGSVNFTAAVDEGDYSGQIQSVTAYVSGAGGDPVLISDSDPDPLVFSGTIPADLAASYTWVTVKVVYGSELAYVEDTGWLP